jgi:hypothetical protein
MLDAHPLSLVLISMPGVGVRTAARILLEVGDGTAFPTSVHLAALRRAHPGRPPLGHQHPLKTRASSCHCTVSRLIVAADSPELVPRKLLQRRNEILRRKSKPGVAVRNLQRADGV